MNDLPEDEGRGGERERIEPFGQRGLTGGSSELLPAEPSMIMPITKKAKAIVIALVGAGLLVIPWVSSLGILNAAIKALIAALFALAFNLLMGQAGLLSFGQAAFFGIGGFATIHLMKSTAHGLAVPIVLLPVAGGLAGLVLGLGSGWFATKRTGAYFAMITLAVAELLYAISLRWTGVFGGEAGISSMRMPWAGFTFGSAGEVYYLVMVWVLGCSFLLYLYNQTPFGRLTLAIRDNENRIRFLGYDTHKTKVVIFGISAMFSGIAGSLLAIAEESVSFAVFDANVSAMVVLQTFIGGCNTFLGPAVGAAVLTFFAQEVSDISRSWLLYEGVIFVLVMMFMPNGIGGMIGELYRMVQGKNRKTPKPGPSLRHSLRVTFATAVAFSAIIFSVEACGILFSEKYSAMRRAAGNQWVGFNLFGARWNPKAPWLWVTPALLFAIGLFLLPHVGATLRGKIKKFR